MILLKNFRILLNIIVLGEDLNKIRFHAPARFKKYCVADIGGVIRIARECEGQEYEYLLGLRVRGLGGEFQYLNCRWARQRC